jgi:uncharacterized protein (TIGR03067 family)
MFRNVIVTALVFSTSTLAADEEPKGIAGVWRPTEMHQSGVKLADVYLKITTLEFEGKKYHLTVGVKWADGTFKLDEKADPKTIDIKIEKGDGKGETYLGVYEIDGDTLTICHALDGENRPTKLQSTVENKAMLIVYKRVKQ